MKSNPSTTLAVNPPRASWLRRLGSMRHRRTDYTGRYANWARAVADSEGYDSRFIVNRVAAAVRSVIEGMADCERDGTTLDHTLHPHALLSTLLRAAILDKGHVEVLDFGGALGGTYLACRPFLAPVQPQWNIVEQPSFVDEGRSNFTNDHLRFYETPEACLAQRPVNVLLASGVLQYLPEPYTMLDRLLELSVRHVVIDRLAVVRMQDDFLTVQHVGNHIYGQPTSYPAWFFNLDRFRQHLASHTDYRILSEFDADTAVLNCENARPIFKGFILERPRK
ncbi:MAG: methyltransferase, TIGR04325 family [Phycisphaera sp.]|nr:methyltransferase, TIGR04325 family [Phycisphaera sp.]